MICEGQVPADDEDRAGVETLLARAQLESAPDECERLRIEGLALNSETAFELATLDERFETEQWGEDAEQAARLARRRADLLAAGGFLALIQPAAGTR